MNITYARLITVSSLFALILFACKKNDSTEPVVLKVENSSIQVSSLAGQDSIKLTANRSWNVSSIPTWIKVSPLSGSANATIKLNYERNPSVKERTAKLIIKTGDKDSIPISLKQMGTSPAIELNKDTLRVTADQVLDSVVVNSNIAWSIINTSNANWVSINKTQDTAGTYTIKFNFNANATTQVNSATFTVSNSEGLVPPKTLTVIQDQPEVVVTNFSPTGKGGEPFEVQGFGFSSNPSENIVTINGVQAVVTGVGVYKITVTVPEKVGSGPLVVKVNTKTGKAQMDFHYQWVGVLTRFVGGKDQLFPDRTGTYTQLFGPMGMRFDAAGNLIVADYNSQKIRKFAPDGTLTTLPGRFPWYQAPDDNSDFALPQDVVIAADGTIYVSEVNEHTISKIAPDGTVSIVAGGNYFDYKDGVGTAAKFSTPAGMVINSAGNLILCDMTNNRLRQITPQGVVTTFAGAQEGYRDGTGTDALFYGPFNVALDLNGNYLVTDNWNNRIRKVTPQGVVTTFAGNGGVGSEDGDLLNVGMHGPTAIACDKDGNIYVSFDYNQKFRWITPSGEVRTIELEKDLLGCQGIAINARGEIFVSEYNGNTISKLMIK